MAPKCSPFFGLERSIEIDPSSTFGMRQREVRGMSSNDINDKHDHVMENWCRCSTIARLLTIIIWNRSQLIDRQTNEMDGRNDLRTSVYITVFSQRHGSCLHQK